MDAGLATVLAAVVASTGAIIVALFQFRKENRGDHAVVVDRIDRLTNSVERVEDKVDSHINDHARGRL